MSESQRLTECVNQTLETMFYTGIEGAAEEDGETPWIGWTEFRGTLAGRMAVGLNTAAANGLAASFLGLDPEEIGDGEREQVVGELTNIVCGSYLSAVEPEGRFDLTSPELVSGERVATQEWGERVGLTIPEGLFRIWLAIEGVPG